MDCICKPEIREKIDDCEKALFGNGREGLITRMTRMETKMGGVLWLCGAMLVALIGLVFKAFVG